MRDAVSQGLAKSSALPENTVDLLLGASLGPLGPRGIVDLNVNLGRDVLAFASGEFANDKDWKAMAGLKMRF